MAEKTVDQTWTFARMVAQKQGWTVNGDTEFTTVLIEGLTTNWNRYGYYLCPCRDTGGSREADKGVLCPCDVSWGDIETHGHCFCALYFSPAFAASGQPPKSIPDRAQRPEAG